MQKKSSTISFLRMFWAFQCWEAQAGEPFAWILYTDFCMEFPHGFSTLIQSRKKYTTTTEKNVWGTSLASKKIFRPVVDTQPYENQENHIYHRNLSSVAPIFLAKKSLSLEQGGVRVPFPSTDFLHGFLQGFFGTFFCFVASFVGTRVWHAFGLCLLARFFSRFWANHLHCNARLSLPESPKKLTLLWGLFPGAERARHRVGRSPASHATMHRRVQHDVGKLQVSTWGSIQHGMSLHVAERPVSMPWLPSRPSNFKPSFGVRVAYGVQLHWLRVPSGMSANFKFSLGAPDLRGSG